MARWNLHELQRLVHKEALYEMWGSTKEYGSNLGLIAAEKSPRLGLGRQREGGASGVSGILKSLIEETFRRGAGTFAGAMQIGHDNISERGQG